MWLFRPIKYKDIEKYDNDYCRRAKDVAVDEKSDYYGVFVDESLVSYFALQSGENDGVFIRRGYVLPQFRGSNVWRQSLKLLEQAVRNKGFRSITFESWRTPEAYIRMFKNTGYKPNSISFIKYLGD